MLQDFLFLPHFPDESEETQSIFDGTLTINGSIFRTYKLMFNLLGRLILCVNEDWFSPKAMMVLRFRLESVKIILSNPVNPVR